MHSLCSKLVQKQSHSWYYRHQLMCHILAVTYPPTGKPKCATFSTHLALDERVCDWFFFRPAVPPLPLRLRHRRTQRTLHLSNAFSFDPPPPLPPSLARPPVHSRR